MVSREVPELWEASGSDRQDLPVVPSQAAATEHRAALSTWHTEEGFTTGPGYPEKTFPLRGKEALWHLGCLLNSATLHLVKLRVQPKGLEEGGALGLLVEIV